ncbi:MAG TPA: universal stress protein [Polyangiaceae bacterium]|nr:universal stress protein [Polyangiaceae bacterium]
METLRKILVPTDLHPSSRGAVEVAISMARKYGATLVLLHVYAVPIYAFPDGALLSTASLASELSNAAQLGLNRAALEFGGQGVNVVPVLREGSAEDEILAVADEEGVDLIVVGTHGRHGLKRALLGSVAESVLRDSKVPVMVVPISAAAEAARTNV